LFKFGSTAFKY